MMESFTPVPFRIVDSSQQLKAFTDPLRIRVLDALRDRAATNQQLANALGEPQAKVLYHLRFLLDAGLIQLVDQQVKGGNVEKYYRSVARMFGLRPPTGQIADQAVASLDALRQELAASAVAWPEAEIGWEVRRTRLAPERAEEFDRRLNELIAEYWGGPDREAREDAGAPRLCLVTVSFRDPLDSEQPDAAP
jgi:DNA-binding transcriptional ArsR family regulator